MYHAMKSFSDVFEKVSPAPTRRLKKFKISPRSHWLKRWNNSKDNDGNGKHEELDGQSDEHFGDADLACSWVLFSYVSYNEEKTRKTRRPEN